MKLRSRLAPAMLFLALLGGGAIHCGSEAVSGPFQPQVSNVPDNFQLDASGLSSVSMTVTYSWPNSANHAQVTSSLASTAGSSSLVIKDGTGTPLYNKTLTPNVNDVTGAGTIGTWVIQLTLSNYSGSISVGAKKL